MSPVVSVVIATHNTGQDLLQTISSVRAQAAEDAFAPGDVELVLVDDGSDDGETPALVRAAAAQPWTTILEIPPSGWPSRPRNTGLDAATGEFVLFMDHDDRLFPGALERMVRAAHAAGADLVVGKEVRTGGRTMGLDTFRANSLDAHVTRDHVIDMLTPHKMWRRAFLDQHGVRFDESLRRLEDHHVLAATFVHAPVVAVVADHPCYQWITHGSNTSLRLPDPVEYFGAADSVMDAVARWPVGPDERLYAHRLWARATVLNKFGATGLASWPVDYARAFAATGADFLDRRIDPMADRGLGAVERVRMALARRGHLDEILAHVESDRAVTTKPRLTAAGLTEGVLEVTAEVRLERGDSHLEIEAPLGSPPRLVPAAPLPADLAADLPSLLHLDTDLVEASAEFVLAHRTTNTEWILPTQVLSGLRPEGGAWAWAAHATAPVDPFHALLGGPLTAGVWDVKLRTTALGYDSRVALRVGDLPLPASFPGPAGLTVRPYRTRGGRLALRVEPASPPTPTPGASAHRPRAWRSVRRRAVRAARRAFGGRLGQRLGYDPAP